MSDLLRKDIFWNEKKVIFRETKTKKDRSIFLTPEAMDALRAYLAIRNEPLTPEDGRYVFLSAY